MPNTATTNDQPFTRLSWAQAAELVMAQADALGSSEDGALEALFDKTLSTLRPRLLHDLQWLELMVMLYQLAGAPANAPHAGAAPAASGQHPAHGPAAL